MPEWTACWGPAGRLNLQGCLHKTHVMLVDNAYARGLLTISCNAYAANLPAQADWYALQADQHW